MTSLETGSPAGEIGDHWERSDYRRPAPRMRVEPPHRPRCIAHLADEVGRIPLKDLVRESTEHIERVCIEEALRQTGGQRAGAAELLGLSRQSLYQKLDRYGIGERPAGSSPPQSKATRPQRTRVSMENRRITAAPGAADPRPSPRLPIDNPVSRGRGADHRTLLAQARDPEDQLTVAFAGVIGRAAAAGQSPLVRGLPEADFQRLLERFFPGTRLVNGDGANDPPPLDELEDLLALLMESRREPTEELAWLAHAVASAAMRDNHLWQDMGLPNRACLSRLMAREFPSLAARNVGDMKWKKFFYRQLCERSDVPICKSPNCADCVDYAICFGPEDGDSAPNASSG